MNYYLEYKIRKLLKKKYKSILNECWQISLVVTFFPIVIIIMGLADIDNILKDKEFVIKSLLISTVINILILYSISIGLIYLIITLLLTYVSITVYMIISEASAINLTIEDIRDIKIKKLTKK